VTPEQLLAAASELITRSDSATAGVWPRTAALLARQALEETLDSRWAAETTTGPLSRATVRSQLICLPAYIDPALAHQVAYTWAALSNACHYHPYELAPTSGELTAWISDVAILISCIEDSA
jgi:hypothetical protein